MSKNESARAIVMAIRDAPSIEAAIALLEANFQRINVAVRCRGTTKAGKQCKNRAKMGGVCRFHDAMAVIPDTDDEEAVVEPVIKTTNKKVAMNKVIEIECDGDK